MRTVYVREIHVLYMTENNYIYQLSDVSKLFCRYEIVKNI